MALISLHPAIASLELTHESHKSAELDSPFHLRLNLPMRRTQTLTQPPSHEVDVHGGAWNIAGGPDFFEPE